MSALLKIAGFTLVAGMFAVGCVVTSDDDDDDIDFAGAAGTGGTTGGSGGTTGGGTGGVTGGSGGVTAGAAGETGEAGAAGAGTGGTGGEYNACEDPDSDIYDDPTQCCNACVQAFCATELGACAEEPICYAGDDTGEFEKLQACLEEKSTATDYDYQVALGECEPETAEDGTTFRGVTHDLIGCIRDNDCTQQCFYEAAAAP